MHGVTTEQVVADQRARLQAAVVQVVDEIGYPAASVAELIARAGVSRRTFYELFDNKQDCFLATYGAIVDSWLRATLEAYQAARGWRERLRAGLVALLDQVAADPLGARMVFIGALGAGEPALKRRSDTIDAFEALARQSFREAPGGPQLSEEMIKIVVGGVRQMIYNRLRSDQLDGLSSLVDPLVAWMVSYRSPAAEQVPSVAAAQFPAPDTRSGDHQPAGEVRLWQDESARAHLLRDHRTRILSAVYEICATQGYEALTAGEISRVAGISAQTFYRQFPNKDAAFLAAYEQGQQQVFNESVAAFQAATNWPTGVHIGLNALTRALAREPGVANVGFIAVYPAGAVAIERRDTTVRTFTRYLESRYKHTRRTVPDFAPEAIGGGIWELIYHLILHNRTTELPALTPQLTYIALAPFLGASRAAKHAASPINP